MLRLRIGAQDFILSQGRFPIISDGLHTRSVLNTALDLFIILLCQGLQITLEYVISYRQRLNIELYIFNSSVKELPVILFCNK